MHIHVTVTCIPKQVSIADRIHGEAVTCGKAAWSNQIYRNTAPPVALLSGSMYASPNPSSEAAYTSMHTPNSAAAAAASS